MHQKVSNTSIRPSSNREITVDLTLLSALNLDENEMENLMH